MKAGAVFPAEHRVGVVELDEPQISFPTQVKLRMLEVGVCGTDREICHFRHGVPPEGYEFLVLGHESLAEVVEVGPAVQRFQPGDLAVPMVRQPCSDPECLACRSGRQDFCYTGDFRERGIKQLHGFMTDFVVDDESYLNAVPGELRKIAVLVEPLSIAEKALAQINTIRQRLPWGRSGGRAVVLGAGPVGLLGAMTLVNAGFETCIYSREGPEDPRAGVASTLGARYVSARGQSVRELAESAGHVDVVYEAIGASQTALELLELLGADGIFCFTGVPRHGEPVSIKAGQLLHNLVLKNQVILGTVNAGRESFEAAIRDLGVFHRRWPDAVSSLITRRYPIEEFREPILEPSGIKNVIALNGAC